MLEEVFLGQDAQRVCVGDPAQQIYGWRNARDVMTGFPAEHLHLTRSFRFGPQIAQVANRWLRHAESDMQLTGCGPVASRITELPHPEAVLCRSNADAMNEVLAFLERGVPVALTGGGSAIHWIATAAEELKAGRHTSHPELFLFSSWGEVQDYVEHDKAGQDLKSIVKLVDKFDQIIQAVERLSSEERAKVTVSTAHKAKGREWASVRIGEGFAAPQVDDEGMQRDINAAEARLVYVAVSRARYLLALEGIAWIDDYERSTAGAGRPMIELSLTGQLKHDASLISQFMAQYLPDTRSLERDYHAHLAGLPQPVQPIDVQYPAWSALGHAIDYRLRLSFDGTLGPAVKATKEPRRLGREEIYQLAGYLLLDYDDQFNIDRLGLYLSRQGGLIIWSVQEFLHRLSTITPLPQLRADLRKHLQNAAKKQLPRTVAGSGSCP